MTSFTHSTINAFLLGNESISSLLPPCTIIKSFCKLFCHIHLHVRHCNYMMMLPSYYQIVNLFHNLCCHKIYGFFYISTYYTIFYLLIIIFDFGIKSLYSPIELIRLSIILAVIILSAFGHAIFNSSLSRSCGICVPKIQLNLLISF